MSTNPVNLVLLVEDNLGDARLIREMLKEQGSYTAELVHVGRMSDAVKFLAEHTADVILLDLALPDAQGMEAVRRVRVAAPRIPLVILSGTDDESIAVQALKHGAEDYLIKGQIQPRELQRALRYAIERHRTEERLLVEKEWAQATLRCIGDAVVSTDILGNVTFINPVAETMTGWSLSEAMGRPLPEVIRLVDAATYEATADPMAAAVERNQTQRLASNSALIRRDGFAIPVEDLASPIQDRNGQPTGAVMVLRDVSETRALTQQMSHAAMHDSLTGLPNRLLLSDRINLAISLAHRRSHEVAVLFLDLNGFKHINDSLGHAVGDKLLQSVAGRLVDCIREPDTVSRLGGDEFVVVLSEITHPDGAIAATKRLVSAVTGSHAIDHHDLHVSLSIGVSIYPEDGLDAETLIKCADIAMYQAKENGRQSYQFFTPDMNCRAVERQTIEENLRRAMERRELTVYYQPQVNLRTGEIVGAEALLRWTHPILGPVSPAQFIPVAEDCGLILPIGAWVLREACAQARAWTDAGLAAVSMAVNVSALQFRAEDFLEGLYSILNETGLDPRCLELEVTESVLMKRVEFTASILAELRKIGVRVAVDDFGMGYSSLGYLRKFPLDALKIDQSFVRQLSTTPDETTIVRAIISMGQSLNLRVVAEGVETPEELSFLQAHDCDEAQGYHFSRPLPPHQFAKLLEESRFAFGGVPA